MTGSFLEFHYDVEADAGRTLLVLTKEGLSAQQLLDFQIAMLEHNDIPGIIKVEVKKLDSRVKLCYKLNGFISLANYLRRQRISKAELTHIVEGIISVLLRCKNYLLNDNSLVLKEEFIYINPRLKQISLIYLPVQLESDVTQQFKLFLAALLGNTANIDADDHFVQTILELVKSDQFSLVELRELLAAITDSGSIPGTCGVDPEPVGKKQKEEVRPKPFKFPCIPSRPHGRRKALLIAAAASVIAAVISAVPVELPAWWSMLSDRGGAVMAGLILASLLAACVVLVPSVVPSGVSSVVPAAALAAVLSSDQSMETSLLSDYPYPSLRSVLGDVNIIINKTEFALGRQKEISDHFIPNKNIGRLHAQISCSGNEYFITDMDSVNGTFINGSRVLSNKRYRLNHNDKITLANLDYLFINP